MSAIERIDSKATLGALGFMMITAVGTMQMQPVIGGALVDRWGLSLQQMGMMFGVELIAMAIGCGAAALVVNRWDRRTICQSGLVLLAAGGALSALEPSFGLLCMARALAGVGGGVAQAVVYATTVHRHNRDRTYASLHILLLLWGAASIGLAPLVIGASGIAAIFWSFPVMAALALPMTRRIPRHALARADGAAPAGAARWSGKAMLLVLLFCLLFAGHGVLWVYQERIGVSLGLAPATIGTILGVSVLAGAAGAATAGVLGKRVGHRAAQVTGFAGSIVASLAIVYGQSPTVYAIAAALVMAVWFFGQTYMFSLTAEMDPSGRLAGMSNAAIFVGQGLGPVAAAAVVGAGSFRVVGWLSVGIYALCLVIALIVTAGLGRRRAAIGGGQAAAV